MPDAVAIPFRRLHVEAAGFPPRAMVFLDPSAPASDCGRDPRAEHQRRYRLRQELRRRASHKCPEPKIKRSVVKVHLRPGWRNLQTDLASCVDVGSPRTEEDKRGHAVKADCERGARGHENGRWQ